MRGIAIRKPDACLQRRLHAALRVCSCTPLLYLLIIFFSFSIRSLLEQNLGNLGLYISARDLLMVTCDLARELQLALARLVDQLVDGVLGQEAADLYLTLLTEAVGTVLAIIKSDKMKCAVIWGD